MVIIGLDGFWAYVFSFYFHIGRQDSCPDRSASFSTSNSGVIRLGVEEAWLPQTTW